MSVKKAFISELDKLYRDRTHWLRLVIGDKTLGRPPKVNRKRVSKSIEQMQNLASIAFAKKLAKNEFKKFSPQKQAWPKKGWGPKKQKDLFNDWFKMNLADNRNFVYVFWKNKKCIYVGRTGSRGSRPTDHFGYTWFLSITRADIYPVKQRSQLPKLECLAKHRFLPSRNAIRPAKEKGAKKCPMCKKHKDIHDELRDMFRLK